MGSILGGGNSGGGGGGGLLGGILGGLPDPLGIGKMLFGFGEEQGGGPPQGPSAPQGPSGVNFAQQPQQSSGASFDPRQMLNSPMGPTGFGIGRGGK